MGVITQAIWASLRLASGHSGKTHPYCCHCPAGSDCSKGGKVQDKKGLPIARTFPLEGPGSPPLQKWPSISGLREYGNRASYCFCLHCLGPFFYTAVPMCLAAAIWWWPACESFLMEVPILQERSKWLALLKWLHYKLTSMELCDTEIAPRIVLHEYEGTAMK